MQPATLKQYYINGLFDPIRRNRKSLDATKEDLGSYGYAGQMMQRPAPLDGGLLKKDWFPVIPMAQVPPNLTTHFQLDPAYTAKQSNDPTGAMAYKTDGTNVYIIHSTSVWKEFPQLCQWLPEWVQLYGYTPQSKIRVEPKASGKSIVQQIKQTTMPMKAKKQLPKSEIN